MKKSMHYLLVKASQCRTRGFVGGQIHAQGVNKAQKSGEGLK